MIFLHPYLLWLLPLAATPIVLYIIFRRRQTIVAWGSTYILRLALASGRRQSLWKQIFIVALRTIFLLLMILAFARPFRTWSQAQLARTLPHGPGTLHRVILIDNTLSMNARHGLQTRFDAAREALEALLVATRPGDTCHVIPLCSPEPDGPIVPEAVPVPIAARNARLFVQKLKPVSGNMDFGAALRAATDVLRESAAVTRQLVAITDLARVDHPSIQDYDVFGEILSGLKTRCATLNLGSRTCINVAAEDVTAGAEVLMKNQPSNVYATLMNYSEQGSPESRVHFFVDGQLQSEQPCPLATGQRKIIALPVTLDQGVHQLMVRLDKDSYEPDDVVKRYVRVEGVLRVLVVSSNQDKQEGFESDTAFIDRALGAGTAAPFRLEVKKVKEGTLVPGALNECDVAFFCGVSRLPTSLLDELAGFVRRGGGLILSVGPSTTPAEFNQTFGAFLPVRLDAPCRPAFNEETFASVQPLNIPAPMLREFEGNDNGEIARARIYNHFSVKAVAAASRGARSPASTNLLQLTTGDPLLIIHPFGKGRVFLWTTTIGGTWSSFPVCQAYLPFLYRLANLAGSFRGVPLNLKPGDPIIFELPAPSAKTYLTTPDARLVECPITSNGKQQFIRIEGMTTPGEYDLQDEKGKTLASFSMAMPLKESDLRMLDGREMALLGSTLGMVVAPDMDGLRKALWRRGDGTEWAGWFLTAILVLFTLDALLTKRWFS